MFCSCIRIFKFFLYSFLYRNKALESRIPIYYFNSFSIALSFFLFFLPSSFLPTFLPSFFFSFLLSFFPSFFLFFLPSFFFSFLLSFFPSFFLFFLPSFFFSFLPYFLPSFLPLLLFNVAEGRKGRIQLRALVALLLIDSKTEL